MNSLISFVNPLIFTSVGSFLTVFFASFLVWGMVLLLSFLWFIDGRVKKEVVVHSLLSCVSAWILTSLIKALFNFQRPFEISNVVPMTILIPYDSSFPSSHSAFSFALATSVWFHDKRLGNIFFVLAILVSIGRVLAKVHFYQDVIVGAFLGILVSFLFEKTHLYKLLK